MHRLIDFLSERLNKCAIPHNEEKVKQVALESVADEPP